LKLSSALAVGAAAGPLRAFARPVPVVERAAFTMGSIVTIQAYGADERLSGLAIADAFRAMKSVDAMMSVYAATSALSALNRGGSRAAVPVPEDLLRVLASAAEFSRLTGGAFDVTVQPLMELYGFRDAPGIGHFPTDREIAAVLSGVGMHNVVIDPAGSTVAFADGRTQIDLGGIAVGYALDLAGTAMRARGVRSALLNHSGDLLAIGAPPDDDAWEIGITDPDRPDAIIATASIRDEALSTSGNYRNVRTLGGRTIGHILDPSSGRTASGALSTTVIASAAIAADALSTGTFVLGSERSAAALEAARARIITVERAPGARERVVRSPRGSFNR
jgi:thiamine biosynthesis lipoprotein